MKKRWITSVGTTEEEFIKRQRAVSIRPQCERGWKSYAPIYLASRSRRSYQATSKNPPTSRRCSKNAFSTMRRSGSGMSQNRFATTVATNVEAPSHSARAAERESLRATHDRGAKPHAACSDTGTYFCSVFSASLRAAAYAGRIAPESELARWHQHRWFEAKLLCPTRVTPVIERKQLAACATRGKMQRIGKIDPTPAVA